VARGSRIILADGLCKHFYRRASSASESRIQKRDSDCPHRHKRYLGMVVARQMLVSDLVTIFFLSSFLTSLPLAHFAGPGTSEHHARIHSSLTRRPSQFEGLPYLEKWLISYTIPLSYSVFRFRFHLTSWTRAPNSSQSAAPMPPSALASSPVPERFFSFP
jgi:hypothetical protein